MLLRQTQYCLFFYELDLVVVVVVELFMHEIRPLLIFNLAWPQRLILDIHPHSLNDFFINCKSFTLK